MKRLLLLGCLLATNVVYAHASTITLAWDPPLTGQNVVTTNIYQRNGAAAPFTYSLLGSVAQPANQFILPSTIGSGSVVAATFVNSGGVEGARSTDFTIPAIPSAPQNIRVQVTFSINLQQ